MSAINNYVDYPGMSYLFSLSQPVRADTSRMNDNPRLHLRRYGRTRRNHGIRQERIRCFDAVSLEGEKFLMTARRVVRG